MTTPEQIQNALDALNNGKKRYDATNDVMYIQISLDEYNAIRAALMRPSVGDFVKIINDRISVYDRKIKNENPSIESENEMRFAIYALEMVKAELQAPPITKELLPCPFCGGAPVKGYNSGSVTHIYCMDCRAMTRYQCSEQDALDAWNTRAPSAITKSEAVPRATADKLAEALEEAIITIDAVALTFELDGFPSRSEALRNTNNKFKAALAKAKGETV